MTYVLSGLQYPDVIAWRRLTERLFSRSAGSLSPLPGVARVAFLRADVFSSEAAATLGSLVKMPGR